MAINKKTIIDATVSVGGAFAGAAVGRVVADKLPLFKEKPLFKHGILAAAGLLGAALVEPKDTATKGLQMLSAGLAADQLTKAIKEAVKPKEGIMLTALGNPEPQYVFVNEPADDFEYFYDEPYSLNGPEDYDYYTEELDNPFEYEEEPQFLSGPDNFSMV